MRELEKKFSGKHVVFIAQVRPRARRVAAVRACVGRVAGRGSQRVRETRGAAAGSPPAAKTRLLGKPPDAGKD